MTQAASKAQVAAVGTVVSIGGVTGAVGTETFLPVGEIRTAKFSGLKVGTTDASTFASIAKRKKGTTVDYGQFTFSTLRAPGDTGQAAMVAAAATAATYDIKVQLPVDTAAGQATTGDLIAFSGIVTEAGGFDIDLNKESEFAFTIDIDGVWTVTAGS